MIRIQENKTKHISLITEFASNHQLRKIKVIKKLSHRVLFTIIVTLLAMKLFFPISAQISPRVLVKHLIQSNLPYHMNESGEYESEDSAKIKLPTLSNITTIPDNDNLDTNEVKESQNDDLLQSSDEDPAQLHRIGFYFDDQLDDGDETDEDEDDFYSQNPVDQSGDLANHSVDLDSDVKVNDVDFDDFYEHAYKKSFPSKKHSNKTDTPKEPKTSASRLARHSKQIGQVLCAAVLARGTCITFSLVEWAIRRARLLIGYQRPGGLNSREPRELTINAVGELVEFTTRVLATQLQLTWDEINQELEQIDISRTSLWNECPFLFRVPPLCPILGRYRTHTGQCNNPIGTHLGSTNMPFVRLHPAYYEDNVGLPRRFSTSGSLLPPARQVAINLHPGIENPSLENSVLFMSWGQLLNHDLAQASGAREGTGHGKPCCLGRTTRSNNRICMPIEIASDDPLYARFGIRCHEFKRTLAGLRPGCTLGPRTQLNTITSYLDASFVYGSSYSTMRTLRGTRRGYLAMWNYFSSQRLKPLLPPQLMNPDDECVNRRGRFCFLSGDARTNQQIQLVVLHTVHTRQHNRLASALAQLNPHWPSDRIYHEARHIHIALIQHILLTEWLPTLLGKKLCASYNLTESEAGSYWDHYDPSINAGVSQAFAAAAFRQGHSTVPSHVFRFNHQHEPLQVYQLRQLFRQPWPLYEPWAMDQFLLGMVNAPAQQVDPFISSDLSGHLLQMHNEPIGLDLTAINIQRGRDQGLPDYNTFRDWCGLGRVSSFEELELHLSNRSAHVMAMLYESVDDIDLFTGGISEYPLEGAQVGPTFACIIGRQFESIRAGDRFWFETSMGPQAFTQEQLDSIKQVSLARIICANSDAMLTIQSSALQLAHPILNPLTFCSELPDLDITLWLDPRPPLRG